MNSRLLLTCCAVLTVINFDFASGKIRLLKQILKELKIQEKVVGTIHKEVQQQQKEVDKIGEISQTLLHIGGNLNFNGT